MHLRCLSLLAVSLCLLAPAVPAKAVTVQMPYEGPAVGTYEGLTDCTDPVRSRGTVCVAIPRSSNAIDLRVTDGSGLTVGGLYYLHGAAGEDVGLGTFCGTLNLPLTGAEKTLVVRLDAVNGPAVCADANELAGLATKGVVSLRLR